MTKSNVEKSYNKLAIHAKKHTALQQNFDAECMEQYGLLYNEIEFQVLTEPNLKDSDKIINTLDYGTDGLPFAEFDKLMLEAKRKRDEYNKV